jgi:hypothetical protein
MSADGAPAQRREPAGRSGGSHKLRLQAIAFVLILLTSAGLYFTASRDSTAGTWVLLAVEMGAMLLALWIS